MINHGYKLELTCDCKYCGKLKKRKSKTFSGDTLKETLEMAKSANWHVSIHLTRAYSPGHYRADMRFFRKHNDQAKKGTGCE